MDRSLLKDFYDCGDDQIIRFATIRAHLNKREKEVLFYILDECLTQEQTAEKMGYSVRRIQQFWQSAADKMLSIPWVYSYARELRTSRG